MDSLHELFLASLNEQITIEKAVHWLIAKRVSRAGIKLTSDQLDKLSISIEENEAENKTSFLIEWEIEDVELEEQIKEILAQFEDLVTDNNLRDFENVTNKAIYAVLRYATEDAPKLLLEAWAEATPSRLTEEHGQESDFIKAVHHIWGDALDKLRVLLSISLDLGIAFNDEYRLSAAQKNDFVFEALVRLHARGCQIGHEILVLLSHGLADGALARWRTLHEIAIVAEFIKKHGQDVAERYLLHQHIDNYKGMLQYEQDCNTLGLKPISKKEMKQAEQWYANLVSRFGEAYKLDYGWAGSTLGKSKPTFVDIEKNIGLEHWRLFVKFAHHHNHATSRANYFNLAIPRGKDTMAAGASIFGLYDPGIQTAYSITSLLATLLFSNVTLDHIVLIQSIIQIRQEISSAFATAQHLTEGDYRANRLNI